MQPRELDGIITDDGDSEAGFGSPRCRKEPRTLAAAKPDAGRRKSKLGLGGSTQSVDSPVKLAIEYAYPVGNGLADLVGLVALLLSLIHI